MKNKIKKIILNLLFYLGLISGSIFSFINDNSKLKIINLLCNFSFNLPKKYYFVFYQFIFGFMTNIVNRSQKSLIIEKKLKTNSLMSLDLLEKTQRNIYISKLYEMSISNFFLNNLKEGDVFFDIGANVGYFSILLAPIIGEKGKIYSFEPEKDNFLKLKNNVENNNFSGVQLLNKAVGEKRDKLILNLNPLNYGGHSINTFKSYKFGHKVFSKENIKKRFSEGTLYQKVDVISIDAFALENNIEIIDMMKIDVEGYEFEVLKGMKKLLKNNNIKNIVCEMGNKETLKEVCSFMNDCGYNSYLLDLNGNPYKFDYNNMKAGDLLFSIFRF